MAREVPELALRIDDHGGEVVVGFLDEVTQRGALARTRGALDQAAAREQLVEVEVERAVGGLAERDARPVGYGHPGAGAWCGCGVRTSVARGPSPSTRPCATRRSCSALVVGKSGSPRRKMRVLSSIGVLLHGADAP